MREKNALIRSGDLFAARKITNANWNVTGYAFNANGSHVYRSIAAGKMRRKL